MIVLAAAEIIAGVAGTATALTYSIFGMELASSVETYKTLAQGQLATSVGTLYTTPAATQTFIKSIHLANTTASAVSGVALFATGSTAADQITGSFTIPANGWAVMEEDGWRVYDSGGSIQTVGNTGPTGSTGATGPQGPPSASFLFVDDAPDVPVQMLNPPVNSWVFLGTISGTGVTVGPLIWTESFELIYFKYLIGGYNGGTPVGRVLFGAASISTSALTNGNGLLGDGAKNATSVSVPGCPLAVTLSALGRQGHGWISGGDGQLKQIQIQGQSGNPAVATSPTTFSASSFFSDLGTNLTIKRLQLTVYDTLIATAPSVQTFIATTQLWAWGLRNV